MESMTDNAAVKRSRKSKMKKRSEAWDSLKQEIACELGLWDKVQQYGWSGLSAVESGRIGGEFAKRKKAVIAEILAEQAENNAQEEHLGAISGSDISGCE